MGRLIYCCTTETSGNIWSLDQKMPFVCDSPTLFTGSNIDISSTTSTSWAMGQRCLLPQAAFVRQTNDSCHIDQRFSSCKLVVLGHRHKRTASQLRRSPEAFDSSSAVQPGRPRSLRGGSSSLTLPDAGKAARGETNFCTRRPNKIDISM